MATRLLQAAPLLAFLTVFGLLRLFPTFASELEERVLLQSSQRLGAALGFAPTLAEDLRLLVMDDASMAKLGRNPTFAEISEISGKLFAAGFERVLVSGVWVETKGRTPELAGYSGKTLAIGSVAYPPGANSTLARSTKDLPSSMFLRARSSAAMNETDRVLVPRLSAASDTLKIGLLNAESEYRVPVALSVGEGRIIPHLSLLASARFLVEPEAWLSQAGDGKLFVDFHPMATVVRQATPLGKLLGDDDWPKGLQGGKVALIVPDGHTGGRFVSSPFGTVPSYVALASLVSSAIKDRLIVMPRFYWLLLVLGVGALLLLVKTQRTMAGLGAGLLMILLVFGGSIYALIRHKTFLPGAEAALAMFAVWLTGSLQLSFQSFAQRVKLNFELAMGHDVQKLFLPDQKEWTFGRWRIRIDHRPFGALSGDWFQVFVPEQDGPFAVVALGDVVGKGTSAALITAAIAAIWNGARDEWEKGRFDVHAFLRHLDSVVKRSFNKQQYSTLSLAVLLPDEAILVCCATQQWLVVDGDGSSSNVKTKATSPVGLADRPDFVVATVARPMRQGEYIMAFTDGLIDGLRARQIVRKRLQARAAAEPLSLATLSDEAWKELPPASVPLPDDATLVLLKYE